MIIAAGATHPPIGPEIAAAMAVLAAHAPRSSAMADGAFTATVREMAAEGDAAADVSRGGAFKVKDLLVPGPKDNAPDRALLPSARLRENSTDLVRRLLAP
ncbi:hypothetical protein [Streptomyces phaeochromogenes]|uniref:hypothetical protein n=1 Tax=Streptomyces phaeochromogenes TaxID=1923 RepID=UPI002DDB2494|nr:hypothetical protein [Streptomyces phaeochromogenes]WRZ34551.1 hypothetical protein OG931_45870 [Streptomyces phaeochromogenes]